MFHQISWLTYSVSISTILLIYYAVVGVKYYRPELHLLFFKSGGQAARTKSTATGDLQLPDYPILGVARSEGVDLVAANELSFAPIGENDEPSPGDHVTTGPKSQLISDFSEMISEVKTLIRVIDESNESKENFEMLFKLIIQKYPGISGTPYQQQINDFLLAEGAPAFPFPLAEADLANYWTDKD